jgi:phosphoribosylanthranilate isomerase
MYGLIQVAGVIDAAEAAMLTECGVDWLGFPLRLPINKEDLTEEAAAEVIDGIESPHRAVVITYESDAVTIIDFCEKLGAKTVQLHGRVPADELHVLKEMRPDLFVVKSLIVRSGNLRELIELVEESYEWVDMFITDTFNPNTGAEGATGLVHDWHDSAELVRLSPRPVILAGGLTPDNVAAAIDLVQPSGVDAHTALEDSAGRKERSKVTRFVGNARQAFAEVLSVRGSELRVS